MDHGYVLHYAPDNASLAIRLALEELGLPYHTSLVDRRKTAQRSPGYLALNPNGLIPVLQTPDTAIFETAAILLWLADRHGSLAPAPTSPERADCLKWLFFLSNTLHTDLRRMFYPAAYIGASQTDQMKVQDIAQASIQRHLGVLNTQWGQNRPCLILDLYLAPMLRWLALYPTGRDKDWFELSHWHSLYESALRLESRASVLEAQRAEGLGPRPFTQPIPPTPPEGSAT